MSKFITYEFESGEIAVIRRDAIGSFEPRYVRKNCYRVFVTVGDQEFTAHQAESIEDAKKWIYDQVKIIDGDESDGRKDRDSSPSAKLGERITGSPANKL